jgi:hypothetical protein
MDTRENWDYKIVVLENDQWDVRVPCKGAACLYTAIHAFVAGDYDIRHTTDNFVSIIIDKQDTPITLGLSPYFLTYVRIINRRSNTNTLQEYPSDSTDNEEDVE